jgi:hypothetical protein
MRLIPLVGEEATLPILSYEVGEGINRVLKNRPFFCCPPFPHRWNGKHNYHLKTILVKYSINLKTVSLSESQKWVSWVGIYNLQAY